MRQRRVLVTNGEAKSFLPMVESLSRRGIEVHGACSRWLCPGRFSRYLKRMHVNPAPDRSPTDFVAFLLEQQRRFEYEAVFPLGDDKE